MQTVTLQLRADDAEPILRKAAFDAAKFGAWCDFITRKTWDAPGTVDSDRKTWQQNFLRAKRTVESFGVAYSPTSEEETVSVHYPHRIGGVRKRAGAFNVLTGSKPDMNRPEPIYRSGVHADACRAAVDRVVKAWRATLS